MQLTPTKFSQTKNISGTSNGRPYSFSSVGFITREHGDKKWFNFAFNGENPLKEGQTYELDIKERHYKDKDGNDKIAYDAKKPNPMVDFAKTIMALSVRVGELERKVKTLEARNIQSEEIPVSEGYEGELPEFDSSGAPVLTEPDLSNAF